MSDDRMKPGADDGFTLLELMLVVAIIVVLAAVAVPGLMRGRMAGNEASAIGSVRTISSAQATYASTCGGGGYDVSAAVTGLSTEPLAGSSPFIPDDLSDAFGGTTKSGYDFANADHPDGTEEVLAADICAAGVQTRTGFFATAGPNIPGNTGVRYFATDNTGQIRQDVAALADMAAGTPLQ